MSTGVPWKNAGVMGLGLSGVAAAGYLLRRGARVVAADSRPLAQLSAEARAVAGTGVTVRPGDDPKAFDGCDVVIASPGVPPEAPPLQGARRAGIPILAEVELGARCLRGVLIGITGSNGKSTVTALTTAMLKAGGLPARMCGNIGTPLTAVAEEDLSLPEDQARRVHYVVELSSFQLEGIQTLRPHIAILTNLSPDHQDRYREPRDYFEAKARIFMNQRGDDVAVVGWDDAAVRPFTERIASRLFPFSLTEDLEEGAVLDGRRLVLRRSGREETIMEAAAVPLPGRHNLENVLACIATAAHCGIAAAKMAGAVSEFAGLPHRLQRVATLGGTTWVNDSKATNVGAALRALEAYAVPVVMLLGGYDKGGDFEPLRGALVDRGSRLRAVVTFGKAGPDIAQRLEGAVRVFRSGGLADAVRTAAELAQSGDVVLLAPACASFDAYTGFEQRGDDFRALVERLAAQRGGQG